MSGFFGAAKGILGRAVSKNLMEAVAAGGVHVSNADGTIDRAEGEAIITSLMNIDKIKASFTIHQLRGPIETFVDIAKASQMQGRQRFRKEIMDIASNHEDALIVAAAAYDVAMKGGMSPEEKDAVKDVFDWAGVKAEELGLRNF